MFKSLNTRIYDRTETILSFFLPVAFFLFPYANYGMFGIMFTYAFMCCMLFLIKFNHFPVFKPLSVYTILLVIFTIFNCAFVGGIISKRLLFTIILYLFCGYSVSIIARHTDKDALYKCWKYLGILVCLVLAYQYIQITFMGQYVHAINVLPLTKADILSCDNWLEEHDRPVSFFTEPAAVVGFLAPLLSLAQQKKDFLVAIMVSVAILLTASTSGLIVLLILWSTYFLNIKFSLWTYILFSVLLGGILFVFLSTNLLQSSVDKLLFEMSGESGNMYTRVIMGWNVFSTLDTRSMLMGIPDIDLTNYAYNHASEFVNSLVLAGDDIFTNSAQKVCLYSGLIGAVVYIWMLANVYKNVDKRIRPYFWTVIVLMFFASNYYVSGLFVMQFIILLSYVQMPEKKKYKRLVVLNHE